MRALINLDDKLTGVEFERCSSWDNRQKVHFLVLEGVKKSPPTLLFDFGVGSEAMKDIEKSIRKATKEGYIDLTSYIARDAIEGRRGWF